MHKPKKFLEISNSKKILSIFVVLLFFGVTISVVNVNASNITKNNNKDECLECKLSTMANEEITMGDLEISEQKGLITIVLLYKKYENDILRFDEFTYEEKMNFLDSKISIDELKEFYDKVEDNKIKGKINEILNVRKFECISTLDNDNNFNSNPAGTCPAYEPSECSKIILVPLTNLYNKIILPVLSVLNFTLHSINFTKIGEIVDFVVEKTPNFGLITLSGVLGTLAKVGEWFNEDVIPLLDFIKDNKIILGLKVLSVIGFSLWAVLLVVHIYCKFHLCGHDGSDSDESDEIKNKYSIFERTIKFFLSKLFAKKDEGSRDKDTNEIYLSNENHPPVIKKFNGPAPFTKKVRAGLNQNFYVRATDRDVDKISYYIEWGDGNDDKEENKDSGEGVNFKHTWTQEGSYTITVYAKDIHGESSKEEQLIYEVTNDPIGGSKTIFLNFLNIFSNFDIKRQIF